MGSLDSIGQKGQNFTLFSKNRQSIHNISSEELKPFKEKDQETRDHELAHLKAAGNYAIGSPEYKLEKGPDGELYANGGEVHIDTSEIANDPQATIEKGRILKKSALAPHDPSCQDCKVAQQMEQMIGKAQVDLKKKKDNPHSTFSVVA